MSTRINSANSAQTSEVKKESVVTVTNVTIDTLKTVNYKDAKLITKFIKDTAHTFVAVRKNILAQFSNDTANLPFKFNHVLLDTLRKSKKDTELYNTLMDLCAFTFKQVDETIKTEQIEANKKTVITEQKSYIVKVYNTANVLNACAAFSQLSSVELSPIFLSSVVRENTKTAIKKVAEQIEKIQSNLHELVAIKAQIDAKRSDLIERIDAQIESAQKQLVSKTALYEAIKAL